MAADFKRKQSIHQLPPTNTPRFTGGKLADIRRKINETESLLTEDLSQSLRQHHVKNEEDKDPDGLSQLTADEFDEGHFIQASVVDFDDSDYPNPNRNITSGTSQVKAGKDTATEKDDKGPGASTSCIFCGRTFPTERLELHQRICAASAEKMHKMPFIVKLGIRLVDGDETQALLDAKNVKVDENAGQPEPDHFEEGYERVRVIVLETEDEEEEEQEDNEEEEREEEGEEDEQEEKNEAEEEDEEEEEEEIEENEKYEEERKEQEHAVTFESLEPRGEIKFPGGGNNWMAAHAEYMNDLQNAKNRMEMYAAGNFPNLPKPPGPSDLEVEYVQCPNCLRRFFENYNAYEHLKICRNGNSFLIK